VIQQGDILFYKEEIPKGEFERIPSPVIQEGESTGHAHRIRSNIPMEALRDASPAVVNTIDLSTWKLLRDKVTGTRYLKVGEPTEIVHEEHKTVTLPPGEYRIGIVQEYDHFKEEARRVVD
jgi:hypothetical protein